MNRRTTLALLALGLFGLANPLPAQTAEEKGLAIATDSKNRDRGYADFTVKARMTLKNAEGQTSSRDMELRALEEGQDTEKSLVIFHSPADTKGTALLSHSFDNAEDQQWLYLPSLKRTRRIAGGNKSGSFVGSEFSYEDISPQMVAKYTYKFLREEEYEGQKCQVVQRAPKDASSGYLRQVFWLDQEHLRPMKVENYNKRDELHKTLTFSGYKQYAGKHWRPAKMSMLNHQNGKSTDIVFEEFSFKTGLTKDKFDSSVLNSLN